ncbi:MAG: 5' nucleotidase, NT5C type [Candidatus Saccharimonadales bacterium]
MPKPENSKPTIVVDIDEVLFPMTATFLPYYNRVHGTDIQQHHLKTYRVNDVTGESQDEILAKLKTFLDTPHHHDALPVKDSVECVKRLASKYRLVLLTARQSFYRGYTEKFVEKHYPGIFESVRYTHEPKTPEIEIPKVEICKQLKAVAIIDDSLKNASQCAEAGIEGILFGDFSWNEADKLPENCVRLLNWRQVAEHFNV